MANANLCFACRQTDERRPKTCRLVGFSGKPTTTGWDPVRIARAWVVLMKRLGYTRFVAQALRIKQSD